MNTADAERLITPLRNAGWTGCPKPSSASLVILVTCSVRQKSEDKVYGLGEPLLALKKKNPSLQIIVTGCMATRLARGNKAIDKKLVSIERATRRRLSFADYVLSTPEASKLIQKLAKGGNHANSRTVFQEHLSIPPCFSSELTALIPISYGCDNFCSYCVVPYTRGPLKNRPAKDIIEEVKTAVKSGKKEIYLLGQNVNSWVGEYKRKKIDFPTLLSIIDLIKGEYWIRFISSHPKDISKTLIDTIARGSHITPYLHFALQSGSNSVLKRMNRHYTYQQFKALVDYARETVPGIAVTSDIIVGFPGETKKEFSDTIKAFKECKFDMAYISMYSPRPGTISAETMKDDISRVEKKNRWQILTDLLGKQNLKTNNVLVGEKMVVLAEKHIKRKDQLFTSGRTSTNKEVEISGKHQWNSFKEVIITSATPWALNVELTHTA